MKGAYTLQISLPDLLPCCAGLLLSPSLRLLVCPIDFTLRCCHSGTIAFLGSGKAVQILNLHNLKIRNTGVLMFAVPLL